MEALTARCYSAANFVQGQLKTPRRWKLLTMAGAEVVSAVSGAGEWYRPSGNSYECSLHDGQLAARVELRFFAPVRRMTRHKA